MKELSLDQRLRSVAGLVRQGARLADIGTDHAYLPLWLLSEGMIESAVCADINEGPLNSAKENAREHGLYDRVTFVLCDGAAALAEAGVTDYAIAGMGGELIAAIIDRAPHLCDGTIRLILQPMSKQRELREYLLRHGFAIDDEVYSYSQCKYYVTICAHFDGEVREATLISSTFGERKFHTPPTPEARGYFEERIRALSRRRGGLLAAGLRTEDEDALIAYAQSVLG